MKKILLTICFAAVSFAAFAQIPSFGFKAGANFSTQTASGGGTSTTSSSLTSFNAGVFVDLKFGLVSIQPALIFTGKGAKYAETDDAGNKTTESITEHLYYLELPVNLVYHIPVVVGSFYFGAGPYVAEGISGKVDVPGSVSGTGSEEGGTVHFGSNQGDVTATQFGVNAIAGFKFANGFLINVNYDLGLTNDDPYKGDDATVKSHVFGVSVGYVFL